MTPDDDPTPAGAGGAPVSPDLGLDPSTDEEWEEVRALGHRWVDQMVALHRDIASRPAWLPVPAETRDALSGPLDPAGAPLDRVVADAEAHVFPYYLGNIHPRAWGWVNGTGTTLTALADMVAAGLNSNCAGADTGARYVEEQVVATLKEAMGWPSTGSGILTSGASVANLVGLAVARDRAAGSGGDGAGEVGRTGLAGLPRLAVYASQAAHNSVDRAVRLLGIGTDQLRKIPVDAGWRMDVSALRTALQADREEGLVPACVVATAGTVDQGAVDPLNELADLCRDEGIWLHVDGAFGAVAALSDELRPLVAGLERADSLAFDLHKWMHVPIESACILVRSPEDHRRPFASPASYLHRLERGLAATDHWMSEYGPQLTRGFRAFKSWILLKHHGTDLVGKLAAKNVAQTRSLEGLLRGHPRMEVLASGPLCVLCFRYRPEGLEGEPLDRFNEDLLADLQESGRAVVSSTRVNGRFALRLALTNHRTRDEDLAGFVHDLDLLGRRRSEGVALG